MTVIGNIVCKRFCFKEWRNSHWACGGSLHFLSSFSPGDDWMIVNATWHRIASRYLKVSFTKLHFVKLPVLLFWVKALFGKQFFEELFSQKELFWPKLAFWPSKKVDLGVWWKNFLGEFFKELAFCLTTLSETANFKK